MASDRLDRRSVKVIAVVVICATTAFVSAGSQTQAQSLFEAIFRAFRAPYYNQYQPSALPPPQAPWQQRAPEQRLPRKPVIVQSAPSASYCVRLCDGRFFPLPRTAASSSLSPEKICSAMCPAADTRVYSGNAIEDARSQDGKPYSALPSAFLFREKLAENCSCNSDGRPGVSAIDIENDPTLKQGDIVMTREGPKVFTGDSHVPHKTSEFTPAGEHKGLSKSVRRELSEMRATKPAQTATTPARPAAAVSPADPLRPQTGLSFAPAGSDAAGR